MQLCFWEVPRDVGVPPIPLVSAGTGRTGSTGRGPESPAPACGAPTGSPSVLVWLPQAVQTLACNRARHRDQTQTVKQQIFWRIYSNLCQGLAALLVKDFFLLSNLNLPIFRLNPCPRGACRGAPSCQAFGSRAQPLVGHRGNSA